MASKSKLSAGSEPTSRSVRGRPEEELLRNGLRGRLGVLVADQQLIGTVPVGTLYGATTARLATFHVAAQQGRGARLSGGGEFTAGHQRACHRSRSSAMASEADCTWPASIWRLPKARILSSATVSCVCS